MNLYGVRTAAASIALLVGSCAAVRAGGISPVNVDLNVADVMQKLGNAVAYALDRHDKSHDALVKESLPRIQVDLTRLAAAKHDVVTILKGALASSTATEKHDNLLRIRTSDERSLKTDYATIKAAMLSLDADLKRLDPEAGAKDTQLTEALFSRFMSQGELTNELGQLMNVKLDAAGEDYSLISDRDKIAAFVTRFDTVRQIEQLNDRITAMRKRST